MEIYLAQNEKQLWELRQQVNQATELSQTIKSEGWKIIKDLCVEHIKDLDVEADLSNSAEINLACNKKRLGILFVLELADELIVAGKEASKEIESMGQES